MFKGLWTKIFGPKIDDVIRRRVGMPNGEVTKTRHFVFRSTKTRPVKCQIYSIEAKDKIVMVSVDPYGKVARLGESLQRRLST